MRPLEFAFVVALALRVIATLSPGRAGAVWRMLLAVIAGAVMLLQLWSEGPRWQLLPLAALAAWFLLRALFAPLPSPQGRRRGGRFVLGGIVFAAVLAVPLTFPLPRLPAPTGPFAVGTFSIELSDINRVEIFGERSGQQRTVVARIWYPTDDPSSVGPAPWTEDIDRLAPAMAAYGSLPEWMFSHLPLVRSNASWNAPLAGAQTRYSTIFFEHGRAGWRSQSTFLTEDLASHGYVVVAVEHPYTALLTVFADGSEAPFLEGAMPGGAAAADLAASRRALQQWAEDVRFVATALRIGVVPQLAGRLDFERVGVSGHSTGGASALELCSSWRRCAAVVALDPWLLPLSDAALRAGSDVPTLFVQSDPALEVFAPANRVRLAGIVAGLRGETSLLQLEGSGHHDFDDTGTFSPLARFIGYSKGPIRIGRAFSVVRGLTRAFFDRHLLGSGEVAPELRYPEVRIAPLPAATPTEE